MNSANRRDEPCRSHHKHVSPAATTKSGLRPPSATLVAAFRQGILITAGSRRIRIRPSRRRKGEARPEGRGGPSSATTSRRIKSSPTRSWRTMHTTLSSSSASSARKSTVRSCRSSRIRRWDARTRPFSTATSSPGRIRKSANAVALGTIAQHETVRNSTGTGVSRGRSMDREQDSERNQRHR